MTREQFSLWRIAVPAYGPTVLNAVGQGAVLPVVALSAVELGSSVGFAAFLVGVLGFGQFAGSLQAGALVVRIGERQALLAAAAVSAVAWVAAMVVGTPRLLALLAAGLAGAVFSLARQSYVTEVVPVEYRARALSTLGGVSRIGLFIGPFLAAAAGHFWGLTGAYGVGVSGSVGAGLLVLLAPETGGVRPSATPERLPIKQVWDSRRIFLTLGAGVFVIAVAIFMALGNGLGSGIVKTLGADAAPPGQRAQFLAGWTFCAELGSVIGPLLIAAITLIAPLAAAAFTLGALTTAGATHLARSVPQYDPRNRWHEVREDRGRSGQISTGAVSDGRRDDGELPLVADQRALQCGSGAGG